MTEAAAGHGMMMSAEVIGVIHLKGYLFYYYFFDDAFFFFWVILSFPHALCSHKCH